MTLEILSTGQVAWKIYLFGQQLHLSGVSGLVCMEIDIHVKKANNAIFLMKKNHVFTRALSINRYYRLIDR